jgi:hypothetical protein
MVKVPTQHPSSMKSYIASSESSGMTWVRLSKGIELKSKIPFCISLQMLFRLTGILRY